MKTLVCVKRERAFGVKGQKGTVAETGHKNFGQILDFCMITGSSLFVVDKLPGSFEREIVIRSQGFILGQAGCSGVVMRMGVEVIVAIIASLLAEQRVIISGSSVI